MIFSYARPSFRLVSRVVCDTTVSVCVGALTCDLLPHVVFPAGFEPALIDV